jgi:hypothetical protein
LLPTLASEETPLNDSTFKLKREKIEKYYIAFQVLLLKMDNNVPVKINHKPIYVTSVNEVIFYIIVFLVVYSCLFKKYFFAHNVNVYFTFPIDLYMGYG